MVAASESPDPATWLSYAQDRKLEDPRYTVAAFRHDIRTTRRLEAAPRGDLGAPWCGNQGTDDLSTERLRCPWVRLYCIRSGRPVPVAACTDCDVTCRAETSTPTLQAKEAVP